MSDTEARFRTDKEGLNPEILHDLKLALAAADRFAAAGAPAALWELFALCQSRRVQVMTEVDRLAAAGEPPDSELLDELRRLRGQKEDAIAGFRAFLAPPRDSDHARVQETLLAFVAISSSALESALRWRKDPEASREDALRRIALIESIVQRYLRALPVEAPPAPPAPPPPPTLPPEPPPAAPPAPPPALSFEPLPASPPGSLPEFVPDSLPPEEEEPEPAAMGDPAAPEAPSGLVATPSDGRVALAWTAVPGATGYRIKRSALFRGPFTQVGESTEPAFVDTSVGNGTLYFYYIVARNPGGESRRSSRARARPMAPPSAPASVTAAPADGRVTLGWASSERAARYRVRRALSRRGPYTLVGSSETTSYSDTAVTNGTTYFYTVVAVNVGGKSSHSAPVQATPLPTFLVPASAPPPSQISTSEVPVLEQAVPAKGALPEGVDLERLLDLKLLGRLQRLFEATAQKIDVWEAFCVFAEDESGARRSAEETLRRWDRGDAAGANDEAAAFFEKILSVRAAHGPLAKNLRSFLSSLGVDGQADGALEIALGFIVSAPRSRKRAERWLESPEGHRQQAAAYAEHAIGIARQYVRALGAAP